MHAYLIVGNSPACRTGKEERLVYSEKLSKKLKTKILRFPLAKIEDARELGKFTALKLTEPTAIIINSIDQATEEAQNAFLKNLEEPQENLFFILTATRLAAILPTIVSRCQIIKTHKQSLPLRGNSKLITQNENSKLNNFLKLTVGEKLLLIDKIKDRGEAKAFVEKIIFYLHQTLINASNKAKTAKNLEISLKTLNNLEANGNVNLQLSNLAINLYN